MRSSAHAENLSGEGELQKVGRNTSTSLKQLMILSLEGASKQGNVFMVFGKKKSLLNIMKVVI